MSVFIESGYSPAESLQNPRIGYQSLLTNSNITASAAVSGFPANNCLIDQTYEFCHKPDVTDSTITVDLGTAQNVDYFGVVGRNMGNVKLESSTDNVTFSTILEATDSGDVVTLGLFATVNARYFKFTFYGSGQEIVKVNLGEALAFSKPISGGFTPLSLGKDETYSTNMSEGGQFLGNTVKRSGFSSPYTFDYIKPDFLRSDIMPFLNTAARSPFFVAWCPSLHSNEVGFAFTTERPKPNYMGFSDYMEFTINLQGYDVESGQ